MYVVCILYFGKLIVAKKDKVYNTKISVLNYYTSILIGAIYRFA